MRSLLFDEGSGVKTASVSIEIIIMVFYFTFFKKNFYENVRNVKEQKASSLLSNKKENKKE